MALGRKLIDFRADSIVRGASSSDSLSDGGFSPSTTAVNLINTPGVFFQPAKATDASTNVAGEMIASCEDPLLNGVNRVFLDDEGNFYTWNGTALTLARTDGSNTYAFGKSDMVAYKTAVFATSNDTLVKWEVDTSFNASYFALTDLYPHPLLTYEDNLYIANGNTLYRAPDITTAPTAVLTLPQDRIIVALGIDPGSGKMLISTTGNLNLSDTKNSLAKVYYYDGFSQKTSKVVSVDQMITAFPTSEGAVYAAYGYNLGYWNGSGVTFLRSFPEITNTFNDLLYKQHFTNIGSTLYFVVKYRVWAHGPIYQGGPHIFYPAYNNSPLGINTDITHVAYLGGTSSATARLLGIAYATDKFVTWDSVGVSTAQEQKIFGNEEEFTELNDGAWIQRVRVILKNTIADATTLGSLTLYNQDGIITSVGNNGVYLLTNTSGAASAVIDMPVGGGAGLRIYDFKWRIILSESASINPGIKRVIFFGIPANQP